MHSFFHIHETKKRTWISTFFNTLIEEDFGVAIDLMSLVSNIMKIDKKKKDYYQTCENQQPWEPAFIYIPELILNNTYLKLKNPGQFSYRTII